MQLRGQAASVGTVELLERTEELLLLRDRLADVSEQARGRLVLVRGEAGIGKTAVVHRFCDELSAPSLVLWGAASRCSRRDPSMRSST